MVEWPSMWSSNCDVKVAVDSGVTFVVLSLTHSNWTCTCISSSRKGLLNNDFKKYSANKLIKTRWVLRVTGQINKVRKNTCQFKNGCIFMNTIFFPC